MGSVLWLIVQSRISPLYRSPYPTLYVGVRLEHKLHGSWVSKASVGGGTRRRPLSRSGRRQSPIASHISTTTLYADVRCCLLPLNFVWVCLVVASVAC
jgi:hypothetical protein